MEIRKYLETSKNESTTYQNLWDAAKTVQRGKFIPVKVHILKGERSQTNNLNLLLKELEKEGQTKSKANRGRKYED